MRQETWQDGKLISAIDDGKSVPPAKGEIVAGLVADADKAGTVADIKVILKKALALIGCILMVALMGCGMFGDSRLYTGILNLCAKCHADNLTQPAGIDNLKQSAPGAEGVGGISTKCRFTMDHWSRVETKGVKRD